MTKSTKAANEKNARAQSAKLGHRRRTMKALIQNRDDIAWVKQRIVRCTITEDFSRIEYAQSRLKRLQAQQAVLVQRMRKYM